MGKNHEKLLKTETAPKHYIFDNEFSGELKRALDKYDCTYEKLPPHIHWRNAAERGIRTFKNHFLVGLETVDPTFPIAEWDYHLEKAGITLNLLRTSCVNPKLSAYAYIHGNYNFNKNPLTRYQNSSPSETKQSPIMGIPCRNGLLCRTSIRTL